MSASPTRELNVALAAVSIVLVLTALVAIHVLERMGPAITRIVDDNVSSLKATGEMLAALAEQRLPEPASSTARKRFAEALAAATRNRTEPREAKPLVELQNLSEDALAGDQRSLERVLAAIAALENANHSAIRVVGADARRLGKAGAWTLAVLGLLGFGAASLVRRRLQRRVATPLLELERVLLAADAGDPLQRCANIGYSSTRQRALRALNRLLDANATHARGVETGTSPAELVAWLLDAQDDPVVVLDAEGTIVSASRGALEMLLGDDHERMVERLRAAALGSAEEHVRLLRRSERFSMLAIGAAPRSADFDRRELV